MQHEATERTSQPRRAYSFNDHIRVFWTERAVMTSQTEGYSEWTRDELLVGGNANSADERRLNVALWTAHPALQTWEVSYMIMEFLMENPRDALHFAMALTTMTRVYVLLRRSITPLKGPVGEQLWQPFPGNYKYVKIPTMNCARVPMFGMWEEGFNTALHADQVAPAGEYSEDIIMSYMTSEDSMKLDVPKPDSVPTKSLLCANVVLGLKPELIPLVRYINDPKNLCKPTIFCYWRPSLQGFPSQMVPSSLGDKYKAKDSIGRPHAVDVPYWCDADVYNVDRGTRWVYPNYQEINYGAWVHSVNWMVALWMTPEETVNYNGCVDWEAVYAELRWKKIKENFARYNGWCFFGREVHPMCHLQMPLPECQGHEFITFWDTQRTTHQRAIFLAALDAGIVLGRCVDCLRPLELNIAGSAMWPQYDELDRFHRGDGSGLVVNDIVRDKTEHLLGIDGSYYTKGRDYLMESFAKLYCGDHTRVRWNSAVNAGTWNTWQQLVNSLEYMKKSDTLDVSDGATKQEKVKGMKDPKRKSHMRAEFNPRWGKVRDVFMPLFFRDRTDVDSTTLRRAEEGKLKTWSTDFMSLNPMLANFPLKCRIHGGQYGMKYASSAFKDRNMASPHFEDRSSTEVSMHFIEKDKTYANQQRANVYKLGCASRCMPCLNRWRPMVTVADAWGMICQGISNIRTEDMHCFVDGGLFQRMGSTANTSQAYAAGKPDPVHKFAGIVDSNRVRNRAFDPIWISGSGGLFDMGSRSVTERSVELLPDELVMVQNNLLPYPHGEGYHDDARERQRWVFNTTVRMLRTPKNVGPHSFLPPGGIYSHLTDPWSNQVRKLENGLLETDPALYDALHTSREELFKLLGPMFGLPGLRSSRFCDGSTPLIARTWGARRHWDKLGLDDMNLTDMTLERELTDTPRGWVDRFQATADYGGQKRDAPMQDPTRPAFILRLLCYLPVRSFLMNAYSMMEESKLLVPDPLYELECTGGDGGVDQVVDMLQLDPDNPRIKSVRVDTEWAQEMGFETDKINFRLLGLDPWACGKVPVASNLGELLKERGVSITDITTTRDTRLKYCVHPDYPAAFCGSGFEGFSNGFAFGRKDRWHTGRPQVTGRLHALTERYIVTKRVQYMLKEDVEWIIREAKRWYLRPQEREEPDHYNSLWVDDMKNYSNMTDWQKASYFQGHCLSYFFGFEPLPSGSRANEGTCYRSQGRRKIDWNPEQIAEVLRRPNMLNFSRNKPAVLEMYRGFDMWKYRPSFQQEEFIVEPSGSISVMHTVLVNERYRTWRGCMGELNFLAPFPERDPKYMWKPEWFVYGNPFQQCVGKMMDLQSHQVVIHTKDNDLPKATFDVALWYSDPANIIKDWRTHKATVDARRGEAEAKRLEDERGKQAAKHPSISVLSLKQSSTMEAIKDRARALKKHRPSFACSNLIRQIENEKLVLTKKNGQHFLNRTWKSTVKLLDLLMQWEAEEEGDPDHVSIRATERRGVWISLGLEWDKVDWYTINKDLERMYHDWTPGKKRRSLWKTCMKWVLASKKTQQKEQ